VEFARLHRSSQASSSRENLLLRELRVQTRLIRVALTAGLLLLVLLPQATPVAAADLDVSVPSITGTTATITWTTVAELPSEVYYGTSKPPTTYVEDDTEGTSHYVVLDGLEPETVYYFSVQSGNLTDDNGGEFHSFVTGPIPEGYYSLTLEPACGVCGELIDDGVCGEIIGVTAVVSQPGTYYITWDSRTEASIVATFIAAGPASYSLTFHTPEAKNGVHKVYLTDSAFNEKDSQDFTVNPSVKISLDEGTVGTEVTLYGFGFDASQGIQVKFNDTVVSSSSAPTADSRGSWEFPYTIPPTPAGAYTFDIGPRSSPSVVVLRTSFRVTPAITITDANPDDGIYSGTVGQKIEINGTGFKANEQGIKITFDGEPVNVNSPVVADENGSWQAEIAVPSLQRGTYAIGSSGELTRARDVPTVDFIVGAGILLEPASAKVGDTISVTGGGFAPEETGVKVYFGSSLVSTTAIAVSKGGTWESSFTLPISTYGSHEVSASGDLTQPAVSNTVNVQAQITGLSPDHGAPGDSVSVTGNGFHANQELTVTIGGAAASEQPNSQGNGNVVVNFHVPDVGTTGTLTLVIADAGGATASTDFTVETKTLPAPILVSPKDSTLRSGDATFQWLTSGSDITYRLQISGTSSFGSASTYNTQTLSYALTGDEGLQPGTYYWRVMATDSYGNESPFSDAMEFRVAPIPTWVWVVIGVVVLIVLLAVAYRETRFRVTEQT
jgi:hypothetical protein